MEDLNLSFLLEHERNSILKVLQKDEKVRKREEKRIRKLKNELFEINRTGTRASPQDSGEKKCGRCAKNLGLIFDRGDICDLCLERVCSECRTSNSCKSQWKCNACAKALELKVLTGEWFIEERSKRYQPGLVSSEVVKQTILATPLPEKHRTKQTQLPFSDSDRLDAHNGDVARRRRKMKVEKKVLRPHNGLSGNNLKSPSQADTESVRSVRSAPSPRSTRGGAVEASGFHTVLNNRRSQTPDRSSSSSDNRRIRPDGAESIGSCCSTDSTSDRKTGKNDGTPTISVSQASVSSDHSRSEMDLSGAGSDPSDEALSLRSRSVPGLNETEFSDEDMEEDIDQLMTAHRKTVTRRLSNAVSTSSINSMMSMYSETGDYGNARVSGEILLNISYSYKTGALNVLVKECHNLATGDERKQRTDAYVKSYLLPDTSRQSKRKTSIKANSINPVFNENLRYVISHSQLETRTLQVSVWHHDRFGHNSFLGEVELTFDSWEFDSQMEEWFALQPKLENNLDSTMPYKGELTVVLKYIPAEKNLTLPLDQIQEPICVHSDSSASLSTKKVKKSFLKGKKTSNFTLPKGGMVELLVKGGKNLSAVKSGGTSDPFVKGYLLPDSNKSTKHKTSVEKRTVNPLWNHTFTYCGLQPGDLNNVCLELTVWDKEALASNVFLGGVRLGAGTGTSYGNEVDWMDSHGEEQRVWQRMVENPEVPHECTLMLRSSMRKHST